VVEAELGRRGWQCVGFGGGGRGFGGVSGGPGGLRRNEGGQGQLAFISSAFEGSRVEGGAFIHFRQVFGAIGGVGRYISGGSLAEVCGAFLSECVYGGAAGEDESGCGDVEGDSFPGGYSGGPGEIPDGGAEVGGDETGEGGAGRE